MKHSVDIHVVLATINDMEDFHDDPEEASERLNFILHAIYDRADDDIETLRLEKLLHFAWETWHEDQSLSEIDDDELLDWVDHALATWDDADNNDHPDQP
ncbi:hypothetical protein [Alteromonas halophila]|uniref:Uncharacterized protein n=1 Tax=Alteromonas halophila TaxID=516698 RepID=A0A918JLT4_9ALTE|nr:hypothetical protein [Alteromonas halophila]GGW88483.1 hypothetical protein GCM10007391_23100 [Alteromonas halophila]